VGEREIPLRPPSNFRIANGGGLQVHDAHVYFWG
jgi:hypothetical protein